MSDDGLVHLTGEEMIAAFVWREREREREINLTLVLVVLFVPVCLGG